MATTRASYPRCGFYRFDGGLLFVPTEEMWRVHEASKPIAISKRARLGRVVWYQWMRKYGKGRPWLLGWLRTTCPIPDGTDDFRSTPAMLAFRRQATIRAILLAARRRYRRHGWRTHVTEALLSFWRRRYKQFEWFDGWLLRGDDSPTTVVVVTAQQARRCARAWDFATFCRRCGIASDTYVLWMSRRIIPNLDWLKWLFGWPAPEGSFVVGAELQRLRREMSRKGMMRAAGLSTSFIWHWEKDRRTNKVIEAILAGQKGADQEGWDQIPRGTRRKMEDLSDAVSVEACCERAKMSLSLYHQSVKEAKRCGVKDELLQYLKTDGKYTSTISRQCGLVATNFFIPSQAMLRFRNKALQEGTRQRISALHSIPGLDSWFLDWATLKPHRGKRHVVPFDRQKVMQAAGQPDTGNGEAEKVSHAVELQTADRANNRKRPGPQKKPETIKLEDRCLELMDSGNLSKEVARNIRDEFHLKHFSDTMARTYAGRARKRKKS